MTRSHYSQLVYVSLWSYQVTLKKYSWSPNLVNRFSLKEGSKDINFQFIAHWEMLKLFILFNMNISMTFNIWYLRHWYLPWPHDVSNIYGYLWLRLLVYERGYCDIIVILYWKQFEIFSKSRALYIWYLRPHFNLFQQ